MQGNAFPIEKTLLSCGFQGVLCKIEQRKTGISETKIGNAFPIYFFVKTAKFFSQIQSLLLYNLAFEMKVFR